MDKSDIQTETHFDQKEYSWTLRGMFQRYFVADKKTFPADIIFLNIQQNLKEGGSYISL
jgi:hypothetical protein